MNITSAWRLGQWRTRRAAFSAMPPEEPRLPTDLPPRAVVLGDRSVELASGVCKRSVTWDGSPAVLIFADPRAAGRGRLQRLENVLNELGRELNVTLVSASSDGVRGTWLIVSAVFEDYASRRMSVTVTGRAGRATADECKDALRGALRVLKLFGSGSILAPAGVDWLARDQRGRWVPNILDRGLWIDEPGRTWESAAYDVAWTIALGRGPTIRDPAAYEAIADCPREFAEFLKRLAGHGSSAFATPGEALSSLGGLRPRRILRTTAIVALSCAAIVVVSMAWIDARIAARAQAIEERSDIDVFQRSTELGALLEQHPMLVFWRGASYDRLTRLKVQCAQEQSEWKRRADELLGQPATGGTGMENAITGLLKQCKPYAEKVTVAVGQLKGKLAQVRAETVLAKESASFQEIVGAARVLREEGLSTDPLIDRLRVAGDEARWREIRPAPLGNGATVPQINEYVTSLKKYLEDDAGDVALGGKLRTHRDEARRLIEEARRPLEQAMLAELDRQIEKLTRKGALAFAADAICTQLRSPDITDWMRGELHRRAALVTAAQETLVEERLDKGDPLAEIAKVVLDWQEVVSKDSHAFAREGVVSLAKRVVAAYVLSVMNAESHTRVPPFSDAMKALSLLVGGAANSEINQMVEACTQGLREGQVNKWVRSRWHYNRVAESLGLRRTDAINRYPDVNAIVIRLRAKVDDHWGCDWIVKIDSGYPRVSRADVEVCEDLASPLVFRIPEAVQTGDLFVVDGSRLPITIWDDDLGPSDPVLLKGHIVFVGGGVRVEAQQGSTGAISATLERVQGQ